MTSETKATSIVPLNGSNYPTWKVQCRMALMKDSLWSLIDGTENVPPQTEAEKYAKYVAKKNKALAIVVLSIEPSLLYLLGDPQDPVVVWDKLAAQFQKKTWANKLSLRRKLYSLRLKESQSVQQHIKEMTEVFEELSIVGDPIKEEDRVVHLLASLPPSFDVLVTALEASEDVPKMEIVTERLLREEMKLKEKGACGGTAHDVKALTSKQRPRKKGPICNHCGKVGHIKRNCYDLQRKKEEVSYRGKQQKAYSTVERHQSSGQDSDSDVVALVVHEMALSSADKNIGWIIDSGATCHMCNDENAFTEYVRLKQPQEISLGDGHIVKATGKGTVLLKIAIGQNQIQRCELKDVLFVPELSYNLLSVSKITKAGKVIKFASSECVILDGNQRIIATASLIGSLYQLNVVDGKEIVSAAVTESNEVLWHRRYGHVGFKTLEILAANQMVDGFDYQKSRDEKFCEPCIDGKHHKSAFPSAGGRRATEILELVHTDVCGKLDTKSLSGCEYFLTFIDDKSRFAWVYVLKQKSEVFSKFVEWKTMIEKATGKSVKTLRTDNGGEYIAKDFEQYLKVNGIRHQLTVRKTPEQNGVAERFNRTVVEMVRAMLSDSGLAKKFWAEALATACYLRNRSSTTAVKGMTPHEALYGEKPCVQNLKIFGCDAYAHVPKDERSKLDAKAQKCVLLGYGTETKGYRLLNQESGKLFYSRDVKFNESSLRKQSKELTEIKAAECGKYTFEFESTSEEDTAEQTFENQAGELESLRRSERSRRPTDFYGERAYIANSEPSEPRTAAEARASPQKKEWESAMKSEMKSLMQNEVWDLVELPNGRSAVGCKWVFKKKSDAEGKVERYKARLVAQGFAQRYGQDYDETFCPVVRFESVRTVIALAAKYGLKLHQMDITTAFLNGDLKESIYMKQPEGYAIKGKEKLVCKLKKSLYGLKQSPRCWNEALDKHLTKMGFEQTNSDPCVYTASGGELFLIAVYVDDIILAGRSDKRMKEVKDAIAEKFTVKDLGELHHFLGVKVIQDKESNSIWIGQETYARELIKKFKMEESNAVSTPIQLGSNLVKAVEEDDMFDQEIYQSAVGSLLYLSTRTRPDISYAVSSVARFTSKPTKQHWTAVKRIFRYLNGTINLGLLYSKDKEKECTGYSDADWAGDVNDRKSTSGFVFKLCGAAISWRSKKQSCVALSTAEAEYIALAIAVQESVWLQELLSSMKEASVKPATIFEDNKSAICLAKNPQYHGRAKHIDIKHHFIRQRVQDGDIKLEFCKSEDMIADMLTKGLNFYQFAKLREMAGLKKKPNSE